LACQRVSQAGAKAVEFNRRSGSCRCRDFGEQRIAAVAQQVQVEGLIRLILAVALDFNRDRLRRLAGAKVNVLLLAT